MVVIRMNKLLVNRLNKRITIDETLRLWAVIESISEQRFRELSDLKSHSSANFYRIRIRYRKDITEDMRITWGSKSFDVKKVYDPDGKRRELALLCEECVVFNQSVVIEQSIGDIDDWGNPINKESVNLACRFDQTVKMIRNRNGEEVVSSGRFIFDGEVDIQPTTVLIYNNESYYPLSIEKQQGITGRVLRTVVNVQ